MISLNTKTIKNCLLISVLFLTSLTSFAQNNYPATGNVGLGMAANTATTPLDVNGALRLRKEIEISTNTRFSINALNTTAAPTVFKPRVAGYSSSFLQDASGNFIFSLGNSTSTATTGTITWRPIYTILNNGNVGIGTTNPANVLHITGAANASGLRFTNLKANTPLTGLNITNNRALSVNTNGDVILVPLTPIDSSMRKYISYEGMGTTFGTTQKMSILNNGNIGLGITNPTSRLELSSGTIGVSGLKFSNLNSSNTPVASNGKTLSVNATGEVILTNTASGSTVSIDSVVRRNISFENGPGSFGTAQKMSILNNGNVGIGVNSPLQKLHIGGLGQTYMSLYRPDNTVQVGISFGTNTTSNWLNFIQHSGNILQWYNTTSSKTPLALSENGFVGINTTSPTSNLEVNSGVGGSSGLKFSNLTSASSALPSNGKTLSVNASGDVVLTTDAIGNTVSIDSIVRRNISFENGPGSFGTAQKMSILNNGNVGVGVNATTFKLDAKGSSFYFGSHENTTANTELSISSGVNANAWLNFGQYNTFDGIIWRIGRTGSDQSFRISNWGTGAEVNMLTASTSGNIGIGTTTPSKNLTIANNAATLRMESTTAPSAYFSEITNNYDAAERFSLKIGDVKTLGNKTIANGQTQAYLSDYYGLSFLTGVFNPVQANVRMFIDQTGKVGVGTTTPTDKFEINSGTAGLSGLKFSNFNATSNVSSPNGKALSVDNEGKVILVNSNSSSSGVDSLMRKYISISDDSGVPNTGFIDMRGVLTVKQFSNGRSGISVRGNDSSINSILTVDNADNSRRTVLQQVNNGPGLVGTQTNTDFSIRTNNTDRIWVNANGNVGIGTNAPQHKLHVIGDGIKLTDAALNGSTTISNDGANTNIYSYSALNPSSSNIIFSNNKNNSALTEKMRINGDGNVGIGTNNPGQKLDILGNLRVSGWFMRPDNGGIALSLGNGTNTIYGNTAFNDIFGTTQRMIITEGGNVGIGNSTPSAKLEINSGTSGISGLKFSNFNNTLTPASNPSGKVLSVDEEGKVILVSNISNNSIEDTLQIKRLFVGENKYLSYSPLTVNQSTTYPYSAVFSHPEPTQDRRLVIGYENGGMHLFSSTNSGGNYSKLLLNALGGNVGIGTSNPSEKFEVNGSIKYRGQGDYINSASGFSSFGELYSSSDAYFGSMVKSVPNNTGLVKTHNGFGSMITLQLTDGIRFHTNLTGNTGTALTRDAGEAMRLTHTGNLGIGTTSPQSKLQVFNGKIIAGTGSSPTGTIVLESQYSQGTSDGALSILGTNTSSGGWVLGYGVSPKPSTANTYISTTSLALGRAAAIVDGDFKILTSVFQTTGIGTNVSMLERMKVTNEGNVGIGITSPLNSLSLGSGNTGIGFYSSNSSFHQGKVAEIIPNELGSGYGDLLFKTYQGGIDGGERMRILNNGNVGIGTSTPDQKLTVKGGIGFDFNSADKKLYSPQDGTLEWMTHNAAAEHGFAISHQGDKKAYISTSGNSYFNGGNVGIGTSSPSAKLELNSGTSGISGLKFSNFNSNSIVSSSNGKALSVDEEGKVILVSSGSSSSNSDSLFRANFKVLNGNIGVGILNPSSLFHIKGGSTMSGGWNNTATLEGTYPVLSFKSNNKFSGIGYDFSTAMRFWINANSNDLPATGLNALTIANNGFIGIGQGAPGYKLDIDGDLNLTVGNKIYIGSKLAMSKSSEYQYINDADGRISLALGGAINNTNYYRNNYQYFQSTDANTTYMSISNGNVGIGTTSPKAKLDINGNVAIGFDASIVTYPTGYKLAVDGNIIAEKVKVKNSSAWPDYVFKKDYKLPSLDEVEKFVNKNSHLPEIPSAAEVEKEGQDLGEMNRLLLKKVEELTLYLINQEKEIKELKTLKSKISSLESQLNEIKKK